MNTRLGTEHHQPIIPLISKNCLTLSLNVHSYMLLRANGKNCVNNVRIIVISVVITVNYYKCIF